MNLADIAAVSCIIELKELTAELQLSKDNKDLNSVTVMLSSANWSDYRIIINQ